MNIQSRIDRVRIAVLAALAAALLVAGSTAFSTAADAGQSPTAPTGTHAGGSAAKFQ